MSLGANFSSGHTSQVNRDTIRCSLTGILANAIPDTCSVDTDISGQIRSQIYPMAIYPSMLLASHQCPPPTPEQFALYPKVATPCSVRTELLRTPNPACYQDSTQRFSQYVRYQPPLPCLPLAPTANMAGISKPSTRQCNLYTGIGET